MGIRGSLLLAVSWALIAAGPASVSGANSDPILVGAGDIATCSGDRGEATAALLDRIFPPGTSLSAGVVFTLGDNAYNSGSPVEFAKCYEPGWGRHKARTRPAPGNHDYRTSGAEAYFSYFGAAAGDPARGYYSYDLGAWHVVVLNSNCAQVVGGCQSGSPQEKWLRADLAAHPTRCALAYWHHPRFNSGSHHGDSPAMTDLWQALMESGVDVAMAGHEHTYERFALQTAQGVADARGIRQFIVGTGGKSHYSMGRAKPNSEVRDSTTFGVLKLTLRADSYDWEFLPAAGGTFTDSGRANCH